MTDTLSIEPGLAIGIELIDQQHAKLRQTLTNLVQDFEEERPTHELADCVNTFLANWLTTHIRDVDVRFSTFLKQREINLGGH